MNNTNQNLIKAFGGSIPDISTTGVYSFSINLDQDSELVSIRVWVSVALANTIDPNGNGVLSLYGSYSPLSDMTVPDLQLLRGVDYIGALSSGRQSYLVDVTAEPSVISPTLDVATPASRFDVGFPTDGTYYLSVVVDSNGSFEAAGFSNITVGGVFYYRYIKLSDSQRLDVLSYKRIFVGGV